MAMVIINLSKAMIASRLPQFLIVSPTPTSPSLMKANKSLCIVKDNFKNLTKVKSLINEQHLLKDIGLWKKLLH